MLRFSNRDIESLSLKDLSTRENTIRKIVSPDFLANFVGRDYSKFGLIVSKLEETLLNADGELQELEHNVLPSYYDSINTDLSRLSDLYGSKLEVWELQVHENDIDVLFFTEDLESLDFNNLRFYPVKQNASYNGIIKAELHAIKEGVSLAEVLLRYQNDTE